MNAWSFTQPLGLSEGQRREKMELQADAVVIASAAGTFPAAIPAFLSLGVIVLDGTMRGEFSVFLARCWAIGSSLQIAAGPSAAAMTWSVEDVVSYLRHCAFRHTSDLRNVRLAPETNGQS